MVSPYDRPGWTPPTPWVPSFALATPGDSSWTYALRQGLYSTFNDIAWVSLNLIATPTLGTGTGNLTILEPPVRSFGVSTWFGTIAKFGGIALPGTRTAVYLSVAGAAPQTFTITATGSAIGALALTNTAINSGQPIALSASIFYQMA